jgi:predicted NUDIX family phosphoesterase
MTDQFVLTVSIELFRRIREFQGYTHEVDMYLSKFLSDEHNLFVTRAIAEIDYARKQLIPYVVLRFKDSVFAYVRGKKSTETRLVSFKSIGVGGHIEPADQSLFSSDRDMYLEAARREVSEEVRLDSQYHESIVALINDDSTDVGKVHLGIMHIWDLAEPKVTKREGLITQSGFVSIESLKANLEELETWSQIALQALDDPGVPKWSHSVATLQAVTARL